MKKIKGPFWSPSVQPVQPHQTRLRSRSFCAFLKAIAGPRREAEREGGGFNTERIL